MLRTKKAIPSSISSEMEDSKRSLSCMFNTFTYISSVKGTVKRSTKYIATSWCLFLHRFTFSCYTNNKSQDNYNYCAICLASIDENDVDTKWICRHRYHRDCITNWNGSCPECRCSHNLRTSRFYDYTEDSRWKIEFYLKSSRLVPKDEVEARRYKDLWKHERCIKENHEITFHDTNHLAGICHNCSILDNNFNVS